MWSSKRNPAEWEFSIEISQTLDLGCVACGRAENCTVFVPLEILCSSVSFYVARYGYVTNKRSICAEMNSILTCNSVW
jgi:hypothetical protein